MNNHDSIKTSPPVIVAAMEGILLTVRICVGATFILAAAPKIMHPYVFLETVYRFELFNAAVGMWIAVLLPWLELSVGVLLLVGLWTTESLFVALLLSVGFVGVQWHSLHLGLSIECGCFGSSGGRGQLIGYTTMLRALVLMLASAFGLIFDVRSARTTSPRADIHESRHLSGRSLGRPFGLPRKALS